MKFCISDKLAFFCATNFQRNKPGKFVIEIEERLNSFAFFLHAEECIHVFYSKLVYKKLALRCPKFKKL